VLFRFGAQPNLLSRLKLRPLCSFSSLGRPLGIRLALLMVRTSNQGFRTSFHDHQGATVMRTRKQEGFSLIELLIVVAIILIIAAIAIPNLMRSRMAANEASAVGSLRTLNTSAVTYSSTYGNGFPPSLAAMGPPAGGGNNATCDNSNLLDNVLSGGAKTGYKFTYTGANALAAAAPNCANAGFNTYTINADPLTRGTTGQRSFYTDQSGVIRFNATQPAAATDPPIS